MFIPEVKDGLGDNMNLCIMLKHLLIIF